MSLSYTSQLQLHQPTFILPAAPRRHPYNSTTPPIGSTSTQILHPPQQTPHPLRDPSRLHLDAVSPLLITPSLLRQHQQATMLASYPLQPSTTATMSRSVAAPRSRPQRPAGPRDPPQPRDGDTRHHFSSLVANSILSRGAPEVQPRDPGNGRHRSMRAKDPQPRDPGNGRHSMRGNDPQPRDPGNGRTMACFDPQPRDPGT